MDIQLHTLSWRTTTITVLAICFAIASSGLRSQTLEPIITFDQSHPLIEESHDIPMVQVFADGTVKVNRRVGNRNPGQYIIKLSDFELNELTALAQSSGVANFKQLPKPLPSTRADESNDTLTLVLDSTTTIMQINRLPNSVALSAGDGATPTVMQTIEVDDVVTNAEANPDSQEMQALKTLHSRLIDLFSKAGA